MNSNPFVKIFETSDRYYMYDVNKNAILNVNSTQYDTLKKCVECDVDNCVELKELSEIYKQGFLSSNKVQEIIHPADELLTFYLENNVKMLILQVTQQCNFRCEYCVYSGSYLNRNHSNKKMSISTALKGIDFLISHSTNNDEIHIGFYGGEPLLEFDFVKQCIEYCDRKLDCKKVIFNITTNGSLLTDEIIEFLYKHNVLLTISLDGPKEIHDEHRKFASNNCGSFDKVIDNIIKIQKKYPDYISNISFNAVIDTKNDFYCVDKFFSDCDTVKDITMGSTPISSTNKKDDVEVDEDFYLKRSYELFRIFYYAIRKKNMTSCSRIVLQEFKQILAFSQKLTPKKMLPKKTHPSGPCIPGAHRIFMNSDGYFYPCEKASESSKHMQIGHIDTGFDINNIRRILNIGKIGEDTCKNCWAIRFCGICACVVDDVKNNFSKELMEKYCQSVKASIEETFKDYCFLKEFGYSFEENREIRMFDNEFEMGRIK